MHAVDRYALADGSYQHALLRDRARSGAFARAIAHVVRPGDVVADLGAGSGFLAHLAVRAGARRVFAVEAHQAAFGNLQSLVARNGLRAVVPVQADVVRWEPPEPVDVVLAELMEAGLLHEPMAAAVRQVHLWPHRPRAFVPCGARLLVEGVALPDMFEGFAAPLPGFRAEASGEALTDAACYLDLDFAKEPPPEGVDARFRLRVRADGQVGALRLRVDSELAPGVRLGGSPAYCTPVVLPMPEPLAVRAGQELEGALRYTFAFDAEPLRYDLQGR